MAASKTRAGIRAITMQQPFAAAMVHGQGLFTRRGRPTKFHGDGGEWVAVHCGRNGSHIKNKALMASVRKLWPDCPSVEELAAGQNCILGVARFVDGTVDAKNDPAAKSCPFLQQYDCTKSTAWRADEARPLTVPIPYAKGNLQVWHLYNEDVVPDQARSRPAALARLHGLVGETGNVTQVKLEEDGDAAQVKQEEGGDESAVTADQHLGLPIKRKGDAAVGRGRKKTAKVKTEPSGAGEADGGRRRSTRRRT